MKKVDGFKRGSGCYTCRSCKRSTRSVRYGEDAADVRLCFECYELAGYENMIQDGEELSEREKNHCKNMINAIKEKNGKWERAFCFLEEIGYAA